MIRVLIYIYIYIYTKNESSFFHIGQHLLSIVNINYHLLIITRSLHRSNFLTIFANSIRCQQDIKTHFSIILHPSTHADNKFMEWKSLQFLVFFLLLIKTEEACLFGNRLPQFILVNFVQHKVLVVSGKREKSILIYLDSLL